MMTQPPNSGLVARAALSAGELEASQALASLCAEHDQIDLRLIWEDLASRAGVRPSMWLFYHDGGLVGLLALDGLGFEAAEATGMVHPRLRRRGIFRALVSAATAECRRHDTRALLLIVDRRSGGGRAFATSLGAAHDFSEHKMRLPADRPISVSPSSLEVRPIRLADAPAVARMMADDWGIDAARLAQKIQSDIQSQAVDYLLATLDGEVVGTLNVQPLNGEASIYGFVVRSEYRGRGYGRELLGRAIAGIRAERPQPIFLEVETENARALELYTSIGFEIVATFDYYRLALG